MKALYLRKEDKTTVRKVLIDMAYLAIYKKIRLLKFYYEEGLFLLHKNNSDEIIKYYLTRDKIIKEDEHHYYFDFSFKPEEVEEYSV